MIVLLLPPVRVEASAYLLTVPLVSGVSSVTPAKSVPLDELPVSGGISVILWLLPQGVSPRRALLSPSQNPGPENGAHHVSLHIPAYAGLFNP